jgi:hypothetical protein
MHHNESLMAALSECESAARTRGHTIGRWQTVTERVSASMCLDCRKLVWVTQSRDEQRPSVGGSVLEQDCSEDGSRASS